MNKLSLTAAALSIFAISCLLAMFATRSGTITGNDRESLGGEIRPQAATLTKGVEESGYRYSNLLWLCPANNGVADVAEWEQSPICVDTGEWRITISGENLSSISWRESPDFIIITVTGTVPDGNDARSSALTY